MDNDPERSLADKARHAAILLRCDLLGESRVNVASDLRLSLRGFERERRAAMERFSRHVSTVAHREIHAVVKSNLAAIEREFAARVADAGDRASALSILRDIATNAADPSERCRALLDSAGVETYELEIDSAVSYLREAERLLATTRIESNDTEVLKREHEAATLRTMFVANGPPSLSSVEYSLSQADAGTLKLQLAVAEAKLAHGKVQAGKLNLAQARKIIARTPIVPPASMIDLLALEAQVEFWIDGHYERMVASLTAAAELAQQQKYAGRLTMIRQLVEVTKWLLKGDRQACSRSRNLVKRIDREFGVPKYLRLQIYHSSADAEAAIGDPWLAVLWAGRASALALSRFEQLHMKSLSCTAFARGGRYRKAAEIADEIISLQDGPTSERATLNAHLALAEVSVLRGNRRLAREHLTEAASLAHRFGSARIVARTRLRLVEVSKAR